MHQEPGCELFALHTDGETVFVVERWATPADLRAHAAGPAYAQIRAGISDLVEHAADVWVLDPLPFGDAAKGTIVSAPNAITNRHAQDTASECSDGYRPVICVTRVLNPGRGQRVPDRSCHLMASPDSHVTQPQTKPRVSTQAIDVSVQSRPTPTHYPAAGCQPLAYSFAPPTNTAGSNIAGYQ